MRTEVNQTRINGKYPTGSVYYFGIAYPVREVDGYKVSTERLEARLEFDGSFGSGRNAGRIRLFPKR